MQMIMTALPLALMGVLTGIYWSVEIHDRRIEALTPSQYTAMHQMRDATFARVMPFVGIATFLAVAAAVVFAVEAGWPRTIGAVALMLMAADIVFTVSRQVPLNKTVQSWTDATIPANWWAVRDRWAAQHRLRTVLCTLSYGALLVAIMMTWAGDGLSNPSEADHAERGVVRAQAPEVVWIRSSTASGLAARL